MRPNHSGGIRQLVARPLEKLMLSCDQTAELTSQGLDERLAWSGRLRVRVHLLFCRFCRRYRRQLLHIRSILGTSMPEESSLQESHFRLTDAAKKRVRDAIGKTSN